METITLINESIPGRGTTVNPFIVVDGVAEFIAFAKEVLGGREVQDARTLAPNGRLIHAEVRIGNALLLLADSQDGWATRPGLFQIWVADVDEVIRRATERGATVVTPPTPFYGSLTLARVEDPWGNLWWMYQPAPGQPEPKPVWEGGDDTVFSTIDEYMKR